MIIALAGEQYSTDERVVCELVICLFACCFFFFVPSCFVYCVGGDDEDSGGRNQGDCDATGDIKRSYL